MGALFIIAVLITRGFLGIKSYNTETDVLLTLRYTIYSYDYITQHWLS